MTTCSVGGIVRIGSCGLGRWTSEIGGGLRPRHIQKEIDRPCGQLDPDQELGPEQRLSASFEPEWPAGYFCDVTVLLFARPTARRWGAETGRGFEQESMLSAARRRFSDPRTGRERKPAKAAHAGKVSKEKLAMAERLDAGS